MNQALKGVLTTGLLAACTWGGGVAQAASEGPAPMPKVMTLVVPFSPGGSNDVFARELGARLSKALGNTVVVENKAGAGGTIGTGDVARAAPDGSRLLFTSVSFTTKAGVETSLPYDPIKSFAPVALVARGGMMLVAKPESPYRTLDAFVTALKDPSQQINYGSAGIGSIGQMAMESLGAEVRAKPLHIPYQGITNAVTDMIGNRLDTMITTPASVSGALQGKQIRAIAMTSAEKSPFFPDLPVIADAVPGFSVEAWWGVFAPAKTPPAVVDKLNAAINAVSQDSAMRELFAREATEPSSLTPAQFAAYVDREVTRWKTLSKARDIKIE